MYKSAGRSTERRERMNIRTIICDRCGEQIRSDPVHILINGKRGTIKQYQDLFHQKDFCKECIEEIIDFALNKDACDECMREMEIKAALLRVVDEKEGSGILKKTDPNAILDRLKSTKPSVEYMVPSEVVVNAIKSIRADRQCRSAQLREAVPVDTHGSLQ